MKEMNFSSKAFISLPLISRFPHCCSVSLPSFKLSSFLSDSSLHPCALFSILKVFFSSLRSIICVYVNFKTQHYDTGVCKEAANTSYLLLSLYIGELKQRVWRKKRASNSQHLSVYLSVLYVVLLIQARLPKFIQWFIHKRKCMPTSGLYLHQVFLFNIFLRSDGLQSITRLLTEPLLLLSLLSTTPSSRGGSGVKCEAICLAAEAWIISTVINRTK